MISKTLTPISLARALFFLMAAIWILLGITSLVRVANGIAWILSTLMFANAGVMLWIGWGLGIGKKRVYYLAIVVLATNILLTITDQFGIIDLITLLIDAGLFALLIATRSRYLSTR